MSVSVFLSSYSEAGKTRKVDATTAGEILEELGLSPEQSVVTVAGIETSNLDQELKAGSTVIVSKGATKSGS